MKTFTRLCAGVALLGVLVSLPAHAAKVTADILPPLRRQVTVDTAERLAGMGVADILQKPFELERLRNAVEGVVPG